MFVCLFVCLFVCFFVSLFIFLSVCLFCFALFCFALFCFVLFGFVCLFVFFVLFVHLFVHFRCCRCLLKRTSATFVLCVCLLLPGYDQGKDRYSAQGTDVMMGTTLVVVCRRFDVSSLSKKGPAYYPPEI